MATTLEKPPTPIRIQARSHYLSQWWLVCCRIHASLGLNELNFNKARQSANLAYNHWHKFICQVLLPVNHSQIINCRQRPTISWAVRTNRCTLYKHVHYLSWGWDTKLLQGMAYPSATMFCRCNVINYYLNNRVLARRKWVTYLKRFHLRSPNKQWSK